MAYRAQNNVSAIADPMRWNIIQRLRRHPMTVGELSQQLPVTRPAVSQHLKILKQARLVSERREGTRHIFNLNPEGLLQLRVCVDDLWEDALKSLARYIASQKRERRKLRK